MFGVGFQEMLLVGLLLLVLFGPSKLPQMARDFGRFLNEARRSVDELKAEVTSEDNPDHQRGLEHGVTRSLERDVQ